MPEQQKSFWGTAPGAVAAIAAMVTALAGAIPVMMAIRGDKGPASASSPPPTPSASPSPTGTASPTPETSPMSEPGASESGTDGADASAAVIPSPDKIDFGKVAPGLSSQPQAVQFVNTSSAPVTLAKVRLIGPGAPGFQIADSTCTEGSVLAPDGSCDLRIRFAPRLSGPQSATLVLDRTPGDPLQVPVSGTASLL